MSASAIWGVCGEGGLAAAASMQCVCSLQCQKRSLAPANTSMPRCPPTCRDCPPCRACMDLYSSLAKSGALPSDTSLYAQAARELCTKVRAGQGWSDERAGPG